MSEPKKRWNAAAAIDSTHLSEFVAVEPLHTLFVPRPDWERRVDRLLSVARDAPGGAHDVFLISLRAGALGLNLTAADYVIHMDPWWNPAVEDQASDRVHRIGQTRPVTISRLIAHGTIEERVLDLHRRKRDLAEQFLEGAEVSSSLTARELLQLLD